MARLTMLMSILILYTVVSVTMSQDNHNVDNFGANSGLFAFDLYTKISESNPDKNIIFSPLSIQTCLALAHAGADGPTAAEMVQGLRLVSSDRIEVGESFKNVLDSYKNTTQLKISNKMYLQKDHEIKEEFNNIAANSFLSKTETVDFLETHKAAKTINDWISLETNEKIKNIVSADQFDEWTRMVLINAVYFKAAWKTQFKKPATHPHDFWISETESIQVNMMRGRGKFAFADLKDLDATAIELPYRLDKESDIRLSMLILLPKSKTGLSDLEKKLKNADLWAIQNELTVTDVVVKMPRFKVEYTASLPAILKTMGMKTMFTDKADFSNLLVSPAPLKVEDIVHKAFIDVNEDGTEAAAATMVRVAVSRMGLMRIEQFHMDHPFLYLIIDSSRHVVPFIGKIVEPQKAV